MAKNTRSKVEEWLAMAPAEIVILPPVEIRPQHECIIDMGHMTPMVIPAGYDGIIKFKCSKWEEK